MTRQHEETATVVPHHEGVDNVLLELGFIDAEELSTKAELALQLNTLIDEKGLTQAEVAAITGMTQPKVSQIRHYKLRNISVERLMLALVALGQKVEIVVQVPEDGQLPGVRVLGVDDASAALARR